VSTLVGVAVGTSLVGAKHAAKKLTLSDDGCTPAFDEFPAQIALSRSDE
jgi:hypothetical protein